MDNIAHTLVGAALGRAVADRRLRYAGVIGAVAANAPDWTELFIGLPADAPTYLMLHRGITHSLLGGLLQIIGLTGLAWVASRFVPRARLIGLPLLRTLALMISAAVLSHLYMDWQGSYGVRPFLPASQRWYYGDLIAIVDVFFWIVPLIGLAWGAERHWVPATGFLIALGLAAGLPAIAPAVLPALPQVALWVRICALLLVALAGVGWAQYWFGPVARRAAAATALAALGVYAVAHAVAVFPTKQAIRHEARSRFGERAHWAALAALGRPLSWEAIYASRDTVAGREWAVPRRLDEPLVQQALATRDGAAMASFARFLTAEVDSSGASVIVYLRDARYARGGRDGWGVLPVTLKSSRPTSRLMSGDRPTVVGLSDCAAPLSRDGHPPCGDP